MLHMYRSGFIDSIVVCSTENSEVRVQGNFLEGSLV